MLRIAKNRKRNLPKGLFPKCLLRNNGFYQSAPKQYHFSDIVNYLKNLPMEEQIEVVGKLYYSKAIGNICEEKEFYNWANTISNKFGSTLVLKEAGKVARKYEDLVK